MNDASYQGSSIVKKAVMVCLLLLATIHCGRSIFFDNTSYINLAKYEAGTERQPFQSRIGMIYVLRLCSSCSWLNNYDTDKHNHFVIEEHSIARAVSETVGILSLVLAVLVLIVYGHRQVRDRWWLPSVIFLGILYASYAARYENPEWYPYDLPHLALFGLAFLSLMRRKYLVFLLLFSVDCWVRETSVFLLVPLAAMLWTEEDRGPAKWWKLALPAIYWGGVHYASTHLYTGVGIETGIKYQMNYHNLIDPKHWPQLASAIGFMVIPVLWNAKYLSRYYQLLLYSIVPGFLVTLVFGIWTESRIWCEWSIPVALLLAAEFERYDETHRLPPTLPSTQPVQS